MSTETFLLFLFKNNAVLIEALVVVILLAAAFLTYRSFKISKDEELGTSPASGDIGHLEEMLKKILEKSNSLPSTADMAQSVAQSVAAAPAAAAGEAKAVGVEATALLEQITILKKELETKQTEIVTMKSSAPAGASAAPAGVSNEDKALLENQIKELQRKLEEFDIISADIADLSFYKEENQRLQKELSGLKGPESTPASVPPSASAPVAAKTPEPVASSAPAPGPAPTPAVVPAAAVVAATATENKSDEVVKSEGAVQEVVDEDLIKEYAAMVDAQRSSPTTASTGKLAPPAVAPASIDALSGASSQAVTVPGMPDIDIPAIGESQAKPAADSAAPAPEVDLGTLDLDKMAVEAGDLTEAAAAAPSEDVLNQAIDPDKLANEASKMVVDPQTKEVMGQFEDFAKKENKG